MRNRSTICPMKQRPPGEEPDDARYPLSGVEAVNAAEPDQPREPEDVSSTGSQGWSHDVFASTRRTGV